MDETVPCLPGTSPQPKTSALAIWSWALGILSLTCLAGLTAIPALICGHLALARIKKSGGALTGRGLAIVGLVTGYFGILVVWLLAAIVIPHSFKTAMKNTCINNLRQIEAAKNQWAQEHNKTPTDTPTENDLLPYFKNHQFPVCPAGGTYTINQDADSPTCSITNHVLQ